MKMIKNATEGIYSFQQALLDKVSGGFKAGQMMIISAGRMTGKSYLNQLYGNNLCKEILLPMKPEPKYKFSREWYVATYNYNYYHEVFEWCTQHFGPHPSQPDAWSRWIHKYEDQIQFRDEKDYAWFVLRWA